MVATPHFLLPVVAHVAFLLVRGGRLPNGLRALAREEHWHVLERGDVVSSLVVGLALGVLERAGDALREREGDQWRLRVTQIRSAGSGVVVVVLVPGLARVPDDRGPELVLREVARAASWVP